MSNQDPLHRETNIIPIKEHNAMLSKQYTLTCHLPDHPSYSDRENKENIENFIPRGGLIQANLKLGMKLIHTVDVRRAINNNTKTKENWIPEMVFTMVEIVLSVRRNRESLSQF